MVRTRKTKISEDEIWDVKQEWVKERKTAAKRFSSMFNYNFIRLRFSATFYTLLIIFSSDEKSRVYIMYKLAIESRRRRLRIPMKSATDSGEIRPLIPVQTGQ